jgi:hypothetical protein
VRERRTSPFWRRHTKSQGGKRTLLIGQSTFRHRNHVNGRAHFVHRALLVSGVGRLHSCARYVFPINSAPGADHKRACRATATRRQLDNPRRRLVPFSTVDLKPRRRERRNDAATPQRRRDAATTRQRRNDAATPQRRRDAATTPQRRNDAVTPQRRREACDPST